MSHDTVIHRIVRPAVRVVARTRTTPNHITTIRLATGIAAAACFATGRMTLGGAIFLLSMLLDRADGELARQTGQMSVWGYRYDLACDCLASVATFVGLGLGLMPAHGITALWLGILAGGGIGVLFAELNVVNLVSVRGYRIADGLTVDPDDAMVFVPILVWLGLAWPMTIAAAIITPIAALGVAAAGLRQRRAQR